MNGGIDKGRPSLTSVVAFGFFLIPMLYFLSTGPIAWYDANHEISSSVFQALEVAYAPIVWLGDSSASFQSVWYADLHLWASDRFP
jgi:hypothetical protein